MSAPKPSARSHLRAAAPFLHLTVCGREAKATRLADTTAEVECGSCRRMAASSAVKAEPVSCTYVDCQEAAVHDQVAKDGSVWARLCPAHYTELEGAISATDAPRMMRAWVRCQGGSKAAARRLMGGATK